MTKVVIWDAEGAPPLGEWTTVLWRAFSDGMALNIVSIPSLIEENADMLRARYLAWVYELGETRIQGRRLVDHLELRPGFSYWWMTLLVEKCNYSKSPQIDNAIRLLAFTDWAVGRDFVQVTLASSNRPLAKCMQMWCKKLGVPFKWKPLPKSSARLTLVARARAVLPVAMQALLWLLHYLVERWPLRGVGLTDWMQTKGRITFVSYLFNLVPDALNAGLYESRYWGNLPNTLADEDNQANWLHLYVRDAVLPNANKAADAIRDFNKAGRHRQNHVTLDAFLTIRVVLDALSDWGKLAWTGKRLRRLIASKNDGELDLWPLFVEDWWQSTSGVIAISNTLSLHLFDAAMESIPKQNVGVYLQENIGWEFGFVYAWKAAGHGRLIGAPHSTVRFWDLRYFFDPRSYCRLGDGNLPLPDQVALNGEAATEAFLTGGYPVECLVQVEALRYLYLGSIDSRLKSNSLVLKNRLRLLVFGDYLSINTRTQMNLLEQAVKFLPAGTSITVKPHPACSIDAGDYPALNMTIVTKSIDQLLTECDVVYSGVLTSAAVDAYCYGIPVVSMFDPNTLNLSPLRGRVGVVYASTPDELARALALIVSTPWQLEPKKNFFRTDKNLPRWRQLFVDNR